VQVPVNLEDAEREDARDDERAAPFVALPVDEPDALIRYQRVRRALRAQEPDAGPAGGRAVTGPDDRGSPSVGGLVAHALLGTARTSNLTVTTVPGPRERCYAFGAPLVDVLPLVPLCSGHTVGIAVVSYAGGLEIGLNADRSAVPDLDVLAEGIRAALGELGGRGRAAVSGGARVPAA
jgi:hypothetical protein